MLTTHNRAVRNVGTRPVIEIVLEEIETFNLYSSAFKALAHARIVFKELILLRSSIRCNSIQVFIFLKCHGERKHKLVIFWRRTHL